MNFALDHPELQKSAFMEFPNGIGPLTHHGYGPAYYQRCQVGPPHSEYNIPSRNSYVRFGMPVNHLGPPAPPTSHAYLPYVSPHELYEGKSWVIAFYFNVKWLFKTPRTATFFQCNPRVLYYQYQVSTVLILLRECYARSTCLVKMDLMFFCILLICGVLTSNHR